MCGCAHSYSQALFFGVHRTLHLVPTLYKNIHKKHHGNTQATRANDAVRLTFSEEVLDVACSIVGVNLIKAHPLSRAVYNVVIGAFIESVSEWQRDGGSLFEREGESV
jgi:sterol desaturase/sphingolipid hydroxylase (fatty acid hydroxylase superfamily)